jgi:hypothetical protein
MRSIELKIVVVGLLYFFTLVSGVWLSHAGKPLNGLILTLHKLIALGTVIVTAGTIYQLRTGAEMRLAVMGVIVSTGLLFLLLFISGAWLSIAKSTPGAVLLAHQVIPFLAALSTAATMYLLAGGGWSS